MVYNEYYKLLVGKTKDFFNSLSQESEETKKAFALLIKANEKNVELSIEEKEFIGNQMKDILKTLGLVSIAVLPCGSIFLILANFFKLNNYILPSSFQKNDEKLDKDKKK